LFTEERGAEAAAKLAARFALIAREVVEDHGGSVIELRGDEALAVFSSARQAVAAAVELQERFVDETIDDPELPMPVGIGLDAREAVPVEAGYRGGALNLGAAVRAGGPGRDPREPRRHASRARVESVRYVDRGKVQLKNLADPVELVRIVPEGIDPAERLRTALPPSRAPHRRPRARIAIAALVTLAIAVGATIVLLPDDAEPTIAGRIDRVEAEIGHRLALHWDGTRWSQVKTPNPGLIDNSLDSVSAVSPKDAWAVGSSRDTAGVHTLVLHWDGTNA
jgi:hypothetical protein